MPPFMLTGDRHNAGRSLPERLQDESLELDTERAEFTVEPPFRAAITGIADAAGAPGLR